MTYIKLCMAIETDLRDKRRPAVETIDALRCKLPEVYSGDRKLVLRTLRRGLKALTDSYASIHHHAQIADARTAARAVCNDKWLCLPNTVVAGSEAGVTSSLCTKKGIL